MVKLSSLLTYGTQLCSVEPYVMVIMCPTCQPNLRGGATARSHPHRRGRRCMWAVRKVVGGGCGETLIPTHLWDTVMQFGAIPDGDHVPHLSPQPEGWGDRTFKRAPLGAALHVGCQEGGRRWLW